MIASLNLNQDQAEIIPYNKTEYPVYVQKRILSTYPNYAAFSHWHEDVEFIYILSGHMDYCVNGETVHIEKGEGIFVNARQFHYGFSKEHEECIFLCILLHPLLLCTSPYIEQHFINPVISKETFPYLILHSSTKNEEEIIDALHTIFEESDSSLFELTVQEEFFKIWKNLVILSGHNKNSQTPSNQHLTILKTMIQFISCHYDEKITLDHISQSGNVGKTSCCNIFKQYTSQSPMTYLTQYRLNKASELLLSTDKTISEICFEVGFSGASYFTESFTKMYGISPREYRKRH